MRSHYVHPKHPPDKEYRDDGSRDMNYPVTDCFRFPKIEHAAMVAAPNGWRNIPIAPTTNRRVEDCSWLAIKKPETGSMSPHGGALKYRRFFRFAPELPIDRELAN